MVRALVFCKGDAMTQCPILPQITSLRISNAKPIFQRDLSVTLRPEINIVLGGNGLGKTTLMQAVVYALTGGNRQEVEEDKKQRWDHRYFRSRLDESYHAETLIELEFLLGKTVIGVRRGIIASGILACRNGTNQWIESPGEPGSVFEQLVLTNGRYRKIEDFYFLVHRLLYLPETRRSLIWDTAAQVRAIMLFCPELIDETAFRRSRAELKEIDSRKRHLHVAVGHAEKQLAEAAGDDAALEAVDDYAQQLQETVGNLDHYLNELQKYRRQISELDESRRAIANDLSDKSIEVEGLREQIEEIEATIISKSLHAHELADNLAIHSLVQHGNCPACGLVNDELQRLAKKRIEANCCAICGTQQPAIVDINAAKLDTLRSQLGEKLRAQASLAMRHKQLSAKIEGAQKKEQSLDARLAKARTNQTTHIRALLERRIPFGTSPRQLATMKNQLALEERDCELRLSAEQDRLRKEYEQFNAVIKDRVGDLKAIYARYATAYLGFPCELVESSTKDRLLSLQGFVPRFNDKVRSDEFSCSEAQRFFLDIAFRMALIDFAKKYSGHTGSFLCETPESALDISYTDNVVEMFVGFSTGSHTVIVTANIQNEGLAQKFLHRYPIPERANRCLNLLEYGQLSAVQQRAKKVLDAAVKRSLR